MKKLVILFSLALSLVTVLCSCKDGTGKTETEKEGGSVVVGITQDLDSLDPHKAVAAGTKEVLYNIFEGLVKPDKDGNLVPAVAESYEISEDGTEYRFVLRENVKFHNGDTVTAADVVYSLKRCAGMLETSDPEVQVVAALSVISTIETEEKDGRDVIVLHLSEPNTELIGLLTCSIIPEDYDDQENNPVGTGPFSFVSYTPMDSFVMERFDDYWGDNAHLAEVTFSISEDTDAAFLKLLAGSIDIFPYLTADQASQLEGKYDIYEGEMSLVQALFLNNAVEPFDNVLVRQAMCYAIDREEILELLSGGAGSIIGSGMYSSFGLYYDAELENAYEYNPEKARELLTEAGYPDGFSFTIRIPSNYDFHMSTGEIIADQLKEVGITATIEPIEWATWLSEVYSGHDFEATIIGLDSQLAPSDILKYYLAGSSKNFINFDNSATAGDRSFNAVYEEAKASTDTETKKELYTELQEMLSDEAASVFLQSPALLVAVNPKLAGYTFYPVYVQDMASVYYKTE